MKHHQSTVGKNDEWITPREIVEVLGKFDLDPCAPIQRPWDTATRHLTIQDDGLSHEWIGRVWLNPPFNRYERGKWMRRMAEHGNGIMLIPAACETKPFQRWVFPVCSGLLMLNHRPHFHYVSGERARANSGCTICLVAYGEENFRTLERCGLGTPLVVPNAANQARSDNERIDWMEDYPHEAIKALADEARAFASGHMLREQIDELMDTPTAKVDAPSGATAE